MEFGVSENPAQARSVDGDHASTEAGASGSTGALDAQEMLRKHLRQQLKENAVNPHMEAMLEKMLSELDNG